MVSFKVSDDERELIARIVDRAIRIIDSERCLTKPSPKSVRINLMMDVTACHANGNPLDLERLVGADDFNVMHDVGGIARHIDRDTGLLTNFFSPRFSQRDLADAA